MATKRNNVMTYHEALAPIKSPDPLITWSSKITLQTKTIMFQLPQYLWSPNVERRWLNLSSSYPFYNDLKTEMKMVKCSVPKGSTLGPLLFLIFVNDLNNSTNVLDSVFFVDDTNLFCSCNNVRTSFETIFLQINYP